MRVCVCVCVAWGHNREHISLTLKGWFGISCPTPMCTHILHVGACAYNFCRGYICGGDYFKYSNIHTHARTIAERDSVKEE